jgi:hypothetical protein
MDPGHSVSRMTKGGIDSEDFHDSTASLQNDFQNENGNNLQDDSGDDRLG